MNVEIETEAAQIPEQEYINGIFVAVHQKTKTYFAMLEVNGENSSKSLTL